MLIYDAVLGTDRLPWAGLAQTSAAVRLGNTLPAQRRTEVRGRECGSSCPLCMPPPALPAARPARRLRTLGRGWGITGLGAEKAPRACRDAGNQGSSRWVPAQGGAMDRGERSVHGHRGHLPSGTGHAGEAPGSCADRARVP